MKKSELSKCIMAAMLIAPASAFAAKDISYNYVEADYLIQNIDMYEDDEVFDDVVEDVDDGDGFEVSGSFLVTERMFLFADYSQTEADFAFTEDTGFPVAEGQKIKTLTVGAGFFVPMNAKTDFVARAAYMDMDIGNFSFGADDDDITDSDTDFADAWDDLNEDNTDGYFVDLGVRAQSFEWLELGGGVRYTDLDTGDDLSAFGNLLFEIKPNLGINIAADFGDNLSTYKAGVRYSF